MKLTLKGNATLHASVPEVKGLQIAEEALCASCGRTVLATE